VNLMLDDPELTVGIILVHFFLNSPEKANHCLAICVQFLAGHSLITFCSAALTTKSEFWSSGITIESIF
jgi:hypothetical protein